MILETDFHDFFPLLPQRVFIADFDLYFRTGIVNGIGIDTLFDQRVAVFLGEIGALDAFALKAGACLIETEINKEAVLDRLLIFIKKRRRGVLAVENAKGVALDEVGWRCCETHRPGVKIFDDLGEAAEDGTMRLVKHDEIEEPGVELLETQAQGLLSSNEEAFLGIDLPGVDAVARLIWQMRLESIRQRLIDERIAVGEKQYVLRLVCAEEQVDQCHRCARLAGAGSHNQQRTPPVGDERFRNAPDRLVLIWPVADLRIDCYARKRLGVQPQKQETLQVLR